MSTSRHPVLATVGIVFLALWTLGLVVRVAGNIIHLALVAGLLLLLLHFLRR